MSKKSKIVAIGSMLFVFSILFIEVILPIFKIDYSMDFPSVLVLIFMSFSLMAISFGSSFFFMEFFVREKTVFSGRPMTGLFSLCTMLSIIIAPYVNNYLDQPNHSNTTIALGLLFGVICIVIIGITVVLLSKTACFFMIKKGFDRSSIIFYLIIGTFISSVFYSFLFLSPRNEAASEGGPFHVFFAMLLIIIVLIANTKTIAKVNKNKKGED